MTSAAESGPMETENSSRLEASASTGGAAGGSVMYPNANTPTDAKLREDYIHDIRLMLEYCRKKGMAVPANIQDAMDLVYGEATTERSLKQLVGLHGQLSQIVAPATPCSLAATTFSWNEREARPTMVVIAFLLVAALASMIGYLLTLPPVEKADASSDQPATEASFTAGSAERVLPIARRAVLVTELARTTSPEGRLRLCLNYLFAAIVGSAFYSLLTAYGYLRKRTFDPSYLTTYLIRFTLGILAGVVMASFGSDLIKGDETLSKLGGGILALLGGYSAQAVKLVLDRFVEVLVTTVKGREGFSEQRVAVATDLLSILQAASGDPQTPTEVKERLDALLKKLQQ